MPAKNGGWFGWFGDNSKSKTKEKAKTDQSAAENRLTPPNLAELAGSEAKHQRNAFFRRVEVCLRLRQIAEQTGNADLQRQAEEMDARAWEIYQHHTAQLPVSTESMPAEIKGPSKKSKLSAGGSTGVSDDDPAPAAKQATKPGHAADQMDGDFNQREQSLINGTFMGRDKP